MLLERAFDCLREHNGIYLFKIHVQAFSLVSIRRALNLVLSLLFFTLDSNRLVLTLILTLLILDWIIFIELE